MYLGRELKTKEDSKGDVFMVGGGRFMNKILNKNFLAEKFTFNHQTYFYNFEGLKFFY